MEKLKQESTEKQELEDGLMTKQKDSKEVESSSTIKAKIPRQVLEQI